MYKKSCITMERYMYRVYEGPGVTVIDLSVFPPKRWISKVHVHVHVQVHVNPVNRCTLWGQLHAICNWTCREMSPLVSQLCGMNFNEHGTCIHVCTEGVALGKKCVCASLYTVHGHRSYTCTGKLDSVIHAM